MHLKSIICCWIEFMKISYEIIWIHQSNNTIYQYQSYSDIASVYPPLYKYLSTSLQICNMVFGYMFRHDTSDLVDKMSYLSLFFLLFTVRLLKILQRILVYIFISCFKILFFYSTWAPFMWIIRNSVSFLKRKKIQETSYFITSK